MIKYDLKTPKTLKITQMFIKLSLYLMNTRQIPVFESIVEFQKKFRALSISNQASAEFIDLFICNHSAKQ
jgi:hypothetical protein